MAKFEVEARRMKNHRYARWSALSIGALIALVALGPQTPALSGRGGDADLVAVLAEGAVKTPAARRRQVGDRRSSRGRGRNLRRRAQGRQRGGALGAPRLCFDALAAGQTTIFALAADGRKIAVLDISVGRDVGRTVGSAQRGDSGQRHSRSHGRRIDHPHRFGRLGRRRAESARHRLGISQRQSQGAPAQAAAVGTQKFRGGGKVVNSLTIRGLDQVSLRVTISEIRREIVKQLGVNMAGTSRLGPSNGFSVNNPLLRQRPARAGRRRRRPWAGSRRGMSITATLAGVRTRGRRAHPRRTDGHRRLRRKRQVPRRRHGPDPQRRNLQPRRLHPHHSPAALWRHAELHAGGSFAGPHPIARRHGSHRYRHVDGNHDRQRAGSRLSHAQERNDRRTALGRLDRSRPASFRPRRSRRSTACPA